MDNNSYTEQIKALTQISKAITSDLYLEDILRLIVTVTAKVMGSNICSLMLIDEQKNKLIIRATQSVSEEYNKKSPLAIGVGIAGKVAQKNAPIIVYDVLADDCDYVYKEIAGKEGLRSLLSIPLAVKNKVIGVINCYTPKLHNFTETEVDILSTIANQAAVAIENTELMVKTKVIQEELETRKLVERAKGIIMKKENLTEYDAYHKIQKYSMNTRKTMREVAEAVILLEDIDKKS